jgi:hypothetical protein
MHEPDSVETIEIDLRHESGIVIGKREQVRRPVSKVLRFMKHQVKCRERKEVSKIYRKDPQHPSPIKLTCIDLERFMFAVQQDVSNEVARLHEEHLDPDPGEAQHGPFEAT